MQGKFYFAVLLAVLGTMAYMPMGRSQRSPYVPMPVNLPGLLPRFGGTEDNSASSSSGGSQPASSSSGDDGFSISSDVGVRVGEEDRPSRPLPSRAPARCPPQQVPCYDCMVYISKTGQITKFSAESGGRRW